MITGIRYAIGLLFARSAVVPKSSASSLDPSYNLDGDAGAFSSCYICSVRKSCKKPFS